MAWIKAVAMEWRWGDGIKRLSKQNPKMFRCKHWQVLVVNPMWEVRTWEPSWLIRRFPAQAVHYGIQPSLRRKPRRWKWWQWFQLWASQIWGAQAISPEPLGLQFWCSARKSWLLSWPLRYPLEAEAFALMATVLQPFLSSHWCLQKAPYLPSVSLLVSAPHYTWEELTWMASPSPAPIYSVSRFDVTPTSSGRALMKPLSLQAWWLTFHFLRQEHRPASIQHLRNFAACHALC